MNFWTSSNIAYMSVLETHWHGDQGLVLACDIASPFSGISDWKKILDNINASKQQVKMYLVPALPSDITSLKSAVVFFSHCIILHINSEHMIALNIISTKYFNVSRILDI